MEKVCVVCAKRFDIPSKEAFERRKRRQYCSLGCYHKTDAHLKTRFQKGHKGMELANNPSWKGGRRIDDKGYVRISIGNRKWVYEHRMVVAKDIGRELEKQEQIHHLDGDKTKNNISNLVLVKNVSLHIKLFHGKNKPWTTAQEMGL